MTEENLRYMYEVENKSMYQIAKKNNTTYSTIRGLFKKFKIKAREYGDRFINLKEERFGKLVAKEYIWGKRGNTFWRCLCDCGTVVDIRRNSLTKGIRTDCGCSIKSPKESHRWKGIDDISGTFFRNHINHAKRRGIAITVSKDYLVQQLYKQNKKCALSGQDLFFDGMKTNASIDRIDSSKGYEEGNIQWVTITVNFAKQKLSNQEFVKLCKMVIANHEKKESF
jgi:hypothetical protein